MSPTIVAIGGGEFGPDSTAPIDRYIVQCTGKDQPHALFIPTASRDAEDYSANFCAAYQAYGCTTEVLRLVSGRYTPEELMSWIDASDLIYVGGGNTLFLYNSWLPLGLDRLLYAAWQRGVVLAGLSAGCIIWHTRGLSDSIASEWNVINCLGFVPGLCTPHYDSEGERRPAFHHYIQHHGGSGLAVDDRCAVVYGGEQIVDVIATAPGQNAYTVHLEEGAVIETALPKQVL